MHPIKVIGWQLVVFYMRMTSKPFKLLKSTNLIQLQIRVRSINDGNLLNNSNTQGVQFSASAIRIFNKSCLSASH